ncbi:hypothetical protein AAMO2058_000713500 [Amorphochlora amoebiformis]
MCLYTKKVMPLHDVETRMRDDHAFVGYYSGHVLNITLFRLPIPGNALHQLPLTKTLVGTHEAFTIFPSGRYSPYTIRPNDVDSRRGRLVMVLSGIPEHPPLIPGIRIPNREITKIDNLIYHNYTNLGSVAVAMLSICTDKFTQKVGKHEPCCFGSCMVARLFGSENVVPLSLSFLLLCIGFWAAVTAGPYLINVAPGMVALTGLFAVCAISFLLLAWCTEPGILPAMPVPEHEDLSINTRRTSKTSRTSTSKKSYEIMTEEPQQAERTPRGGFRRETEKLNLVINLTICSLLISSLSHLSIVSFSLLLPFHPSSLTLFLCFPIPSPPSHINYFSLLPPSLSSLML